MAVDRAPVVDQNFTATVAALTPGTPRTDPDNPVRPGAALTARIALGQFESQLIVVPGPGDALGAPVARVLIGTGGRGLRDRSDFDEAQASDTPLVASMARPAQRSWVT